MKKSLVLTVIGTDRPGLVEALSQALANHQANWLESRMANLAGHFAGIVHVNVPESEQTALEKDLRELASQGLKVVIEQTSEAHVEPRRALSLELTGQDRPGIVRDISHALASLEVSIEELQTEVVSASMSAETLFKATARLSVPGDVSNERLQEVLEGLANEMMVDINLDEAVDA